VSWLKIKKPFFINLIWKQLLFDDAIRFINLIATSLQKSSKRCSKSLAPAINPIFYEPVFLPPLTANPFPCSVASLGQFGFL